MWARAKQTLASLALALALYVCVWICRIFFAGDIVGSLMHLTGRPAIAWIAIIGGALPALPLGLAYGFMRVRDTITGAIVVAALACVVELAASSVAIAWWKFVTWWVLPLESLTVLVVFVTAALIGSRLLRRVGPRARFRFGLGLFVLFTLGALAGPWLYSCIRFNVCSVYA